MSDTSLSPSELRELTWGWWLALLIGVVSIVAGVIVIAKPSNSLATLAVIFGIFILVDGIVELVAALSGETQNRGLLAVLGVLSLFRPRGCGGCSAQGADALLTAAASLVGESHRPPRSRSGSIRTSATSPY